MRPFWNKKTSLPAQPVTAAPDQDLLAQEEEEAFVASVRKKRQELAAQAAQEVVAKDVETEEIEWSEQEDVYRPQQMRAEEFLAGLTLQQRPDLKVGESWCLVRQSAFDKIQAHLRSNTHIELGGLLVGEAIYDAERGLYCVLIEEALPAHDGEGTAITFAYTEATWQTLSPQLQKLPMNWTLLGSYHSHPGMGVFLSATDLETQRGVFFHDWQIALVIDPISHAVGFFLGAEGHPCRAWAVV